MSTPATLITVLMAVHNRKRHLKQAIESIQTQTLKDFRFVIVEDGPTGECRPLVEKYAREDPRISLLQLPEKSGSGAAWNAGLSEVRSEYVALMDSDDISLPNRLERQLRFAQKNPEVVLAGSGCNVIDPSDRCLMRSVVLPTDHNEIETLLLNVKWPIIHPSVIVRTEALRKAGGYRTEYVPHDHDLFLRMAEVGRLSNIPEILISYRIHLNQWISGAGRPSNMGCIIDEALSRRGLTQAPDLSTTSHPGFQLYVPPQRRLSWALSDLIYMRPHSIKSFKLECLRAFPEISQRVSRKLGKLWRNLATLTKGGYWAKYFHVHNEESK